jgi:hypothetical protein
MDPENEPVPGPSRSRGFAFARVKRRQGVPFAKLSVRLGVRQHFRNAERPRGREIVVPRGRKCFAETRIGQIWLWNMNQGLTAGKRPPS